MNFIKKYGCIFVTLVVFSAHAMQQEPIAEVFYELAQRVNLVEQNESDLAHSHEKIKYIFKKLKIDHARYNKIWLHSVARHGKKSTIDTFLEVGFDIEAYDEEGKTPLMYAAIAGNIDGVKALLARNASTTVKSQGGLTAMDWVGFVDTLTKKAQESDKPELGAGLLAFMIARSAERCYPDRDPFAEWRSAIEEHAALQGSGAASRAV